VAGLLAVLHQVKARDQVRKRAGRAAADVNFDHLPATGS
jgi:hypothetical protein